MRTMVKLDARKSGSFKIGGDIEIHRLGFGAMRITGPRVWGPPLDRAEAIRTLKRLPELGINFVDTADSYGPDVSEQLVHETLYPYDGILIATKAGLTRPGPGSWERDGRPDYLRKEAIKSREQLGLEQIGLWQLHSIDPKVPRDEQFAAVAALDDVAWYVLHAAWVPRCWHNTTALRCFSSSHGSYPVPAMYSRWEATWRRTEPRATTDANREMSALGH
jgi:diketogulonate reductase-like aldo/keto reductase